MTDTLYDIDLIDGRRITVSGDDQLAGYAAVTDIYTDTHSDHTGSWVKLADATRTTADAGMTILVIDGKSRWMGPKDRVDRFKIGAAIAAMASERSDITIQTVGTAHSFSDRRLPMHSARKEKTVDYRASTTPLKKGEIHFSQIIGEKNVRLVDAANRLDKDGIIRLMGEGADALALAALEVVKYPANSKARDILRYLLERGAGRYEGLLLELAELGNPSLENHITEAQATMMVDLIMSYAPTKSDVLIPYRKFMKNGWNSLAKFIMLKVGAI